MFLPSPGNTWTQVATRSRLRILRVAIVQRGVAPI